MLTHSYVYIHIYVQYIRNIYIYTEHGSNGSVGNNNSSKLSTSGTQMGACLGKRALFTKQAVFHLE